MATSPTEICNLALAKIGEPQILSLDEAIKSARECKLVYNHMRRQLLRKSDWNFAITRVGLALLSEEPNYEFTYQFALPSDYLRIITHSYQEHSDFRYKIEKDKLLCDEPTISIRYVFDNQDVSSFDDLFTECLILKLAAHLAVPIAGDEVLRDRMLEEYKMVAPSAESLDSQEDSPDNFVTSTWVESRL